MRFDQAFVFQLKTFHVCMSRADRWILIIVKMIAFAFFVVLYLVDIVATVGAIENTVKEILLYGNHSSFSAHKKFV